MKLTGETPKMRRASESVDSSLEEGLQKVRDWRMAWRGFGMASLVMYHYSLCLGLFAKAGRDSFHTFELKLYGSLDTQGGGSGT